MKVLVVYYSMYGHVHKMAEAIADGVREVPGAEVALRRVPETLPTDVLEKMGAVQAQKAFEHIPVCTVDELAQADAIIFGTPTRFGNMCGQMPVSGCNRAALGKRSTRRQGRQRLRRQRHTAWWTGVNDTQFPYDTAASGHGHCRTSVYISGSNAY